MNQIVKEHKRKGVDLNAKAKRSTNVTFNRVHYTQNSSRNIQRICARIRVVGNFRPIKPSAQSRRLETALKRRLDACITERKRAYEICIEFEENTKCSRSNRNNRKGG